MPANHPGNTDPAAVGPLSGSRKRCWSASTTWTHCAPRPRSSSRISGMAVTAAAAHWARWPANSQSRAGSSTASTAMRHQSQLGSDSHQEPPTCASPRIRSAHQLAATTAHTVAMPTTAWPIRPRTSQHIDSCQTERTSSRSGGRHRSTPTGKSSVLGSETEDTRCRFTVSLTAPPAALAPPPVADFAAVAPGCRCRTICYEITSPAANLGRYGGPRRGIPRGLREDRLW